MPGSSSEAAEQVVRLSLDGTEFVLKIAGSATKNIIAGLYAVSKDTSNKKGKVRLGKMLRSGKELKIFSIKKEDMKTFSKEAKSYGVSYCSLVNKRNKDIDGMIDIMVPAEDAPKVNRIIERFGLNTVDKATIKSEIEKEIEKNNSESPKDLSENKPDIGFKTKNKEDIIMMEDKKNPLEKHQSENSLANKNKSEGTINKSKKKSVKGELFEIEKVINARKKSKRREKSIQKKTKIKRGKER